MANIEEKVENLIKSPIENLGYSLYDVQYAKEGQDHYLRVFIEKPDGAIDLNDCEKVNNEINDLLDEANYIKEQYFLEVSSTGIEMVLRKDKHLEQNIGKEVEVKLFKPMEIGKEENEQMTNNSDKKSSKEKSKKSKEFIGYIESFDKDNVSFRLQDNKVIHLKRNDISQIKLKFDWNNMK